MATIVNLKLKGITLRGEQETKKHTITINKDFKLKRTSLADLQKIKSNLNWEKAFPNGTKQTRKEQVDEYIANENLIWPLMLEFDWGTCLDWKVVSLGEKKKKKTTTTALATTKKEKKAEKETEKLNSLMEILVKGEKIGSDMYYEMLAVHKQMKDTISHLPYEEQFSILCSATGVAAKSGATAYKNMSAKLDWDSDENIEKIRSKRLREFKKKDDEKIEERLKKIYSKADSEVIETMKGLKKLKKS